MKKNNKTIIEDIHQTLNVDKATNLQMKTPFGEMYEFSVRETLTLNEAISFTETALEICFLTNEDEGVSFFPELKEFAFKVAIIAYYTDLEMPESTEHLYDVIYNTELFNMVIEIVGADQFSELRSSFDYAVNDKLSKIMINESRLYETPADKMYFAIESLAYHVRDILNKIDSSADLLDQDSTKSVMGFLEKIDSGEINVEETIANILKSKSEES